MKYSSFFRALQQTLLQHVLNVRRLLRGLLAQEAGFYLKALDFIQQIIAAKIIKKNRRKSNRAMPPALKQEKMQIALSVKRNRIWQR